MRITKDIAPYSILQTASLLDSLVRINQNKCRIVFILDDDGKLVGVLSDGDFRRWLLSTQSNDLNISVSQVMNTSFVSLDVHTSLSRIEQSYDERFSLLPLTDELGRLAAIVLKEDDQIEIDGSVIGQKSPCYLIAEIGNNHNGQLELAKSLVDHAIEAGADCVKFQMRNMQALYNKSTSEVDHSADLGAQYLLDLLDKYQLSNPQLIEIFDYCKQRGITPLCTPWDDASLELLEAYGMPAYKVASADLTNMPFLDKLAKTNKPLICSTGMSTEAEIKKAVAVLQQNRCQYILLHCNSTYPAPYKDVNLAYLKRLQALSGNVVGYSGHERGTIVPVAAVALGAKVIEKHFTLDKSLPGNDHKVSLLPEEFAEMHRSIRIIEQSIGEGGGRQISQGELMNRETLAKSLISTRDIQQGDRITRNDIEVKSPGQGLQPCYLDDLIGVIAKREIPSGGYFHLSDLQEDLIPPRDYHFNRPFGVPVRYHDYQKINSLSNLDFVEFHLSYQDLNIDIDTIFDSPQSIGYAVHAPELFCDDHILDLATTDEEHLKISIDALQRVVEISNALKTYFPQTASPVIVVNAGGFSDSSFIAKSDRAAAYLRVADNLKEIRQHGVEIIIQTMPPFPWHFGGQRYHNLFVDPDEIAAFCDQHGYRICYDVSHSMMACNYYGWDLPTFTKKVAPYTAHMHIVDAKGDDGEGIRIGEGDVDFYQLSADLNQYAPDIPFIPEIWQGHKNDGEGFWQALDFLENSFGTSSET
jgi:N-acetylneuraminate synthase